MRSRDSLTNTDREARGGTVQMLMAAFLNSPLVIHSYLIPPAVHFSSAIWASPPLTHRDTHRASDSFESFPDHSGVVPNAHAHCALTDHSTPVMLRGAEPATRERELNRRVCALARCDR